MKTNNKGFSYVADEGGRNVKSIQELHSGDVLNIYMTDGTVKAKVEDTIGRTLNER